MAHFRTESTAHAGAGGAATRRRWVDGRARGGAGGPAAWELAPPPPVLPVPVRPAGAASGRTTTPVWSVVAGSPMSPGAASVGPARRSTSGSSGATNLSSMASAFAVSLLAFYLLQFAVAFLSWYDAEIRTPGQTDAMVAWAVCSALVLPSLLLRSRWRALPLALAAAAGAIAPILLSWDLLGLLGVPDVWVGQSLTLHVLFPLCLGLTGVVVAVLPGGSRPAQEAL